MIIERVSGIMCSALSGLYLAEYLTDDEKDNTDLIFSILYGVLSICWAVVMAMKLKKEGEE